MAQLAGDVLCNLYIGGPEVDIVGDQGHARTDRRNTSGGMDLGWAEVGPPLRLPELRGHPFELAFADLGQVAAMRSGCRLLVQENGEIQRFGRGGGDFPRQLDGLIHGHASDGDKRHHVHRAHARVLAAVFTQID